MPLTRDIFLPRLPSPIKLAILPFENSGGDPANQAFSDGLMESAISSLRRFQPAVAVTPAAETRRLGIKTPDAATKLAGANLTI